MEPPPPRTNIPATRAAERRSLIPAPRRRHARSGLTCSRLPLSCLRERLEKSPTDPGDQPLQTGAPTAASGALEKRFGNELEGVGDKNRQGTIAVAAVAGMLGVRAVL